MNTSKDELGYSVIADGIDAGRYATVEVAIQSHYDDLHGLISDLSKDAMGFRLRDDFSNASFFQLEMEVEYWERQLAVQTIDWDKRDLETFLQYAPDEETARRWLEEAA